MEPVLAMVDRIADSDVTVLLRGESGVGKEVIARELHRRSRRRPKPFVKVNCAALPADLLESELFGHERGAFTGAGALRIGKFEFAQSGTILLDEISEMPAALQAKLLHALQDAQFCRLGSNRSIDVDVRVIAATNQHLESMMRAGTFREDLYDRLQVIELHVPPLRDRREEIPALVEFFLGKYAGVYRRPPVRPSRALLEALRDYAWPGNIRELENMMKRFVVLQDEQYITGELARLMRASRDAEADAFAPDAIPTRAAPVSAPDADEEAADNDPAESPSGVDLQHARQGGFNSHRAPGDRRGARHVPVESTQGGEASQRQLQNAPEQNEGVRHHRPRHVPFLGSFLLTRIAPASPRTPPIWQWTCTTASESPNHRRTTPQGKEQLAMKAIGIVLVALGIVGLIYGGVSWTYRDKVVDAGPIEITQNKTKSVPLPPVAGAILLVAGVVVLMRGNKLSA